jgi:LysM repeat protein
MRARLGLATALSALVPTLAWAQTAPMTPTTTTTTTTIAVQPPQPGSTYSPTTGSFGNPQAPNGTIGGGNATESSAHPVTGEEEDSFDIGSKGGAAGGAAHGDENGPVFSASSGPVTISGETPQTHVVKRGDTLWGIGDYYFKNPYEWPKLWSYNPQIKNPNWIYPGDELKLLPPGGEAGVAAAPGAPGQPGKGGQGSLSIIDRRHKVPNDTVFLRDQGWIRENGDEVWGDVTGAAEDKMFLSDFDQIYLHIDEGHDVHIGQELTIFRPVHPVTNAGAIVMIEGTARIDQWNARDRVARALIVETLNVIERGAKIGPLARSFEIVPPRRNDEDISARVLASVHPNEFYGQNQVIFIDKGEADGLKLGNRLFVVRRGDPWRQSLIEPIAGYRVSADDEKPMPEMENTPGSRRDDKTYPDEVTGELRVVALKKDSATCVVTQSTFEIERSDLVVARSGY